MTINELVQKIATRAGELSEKKMEYLRYEHPDNDSEYKLTNRAQFKGVGRPKLIADILYEEFSLDNDEEIDYIRSYF